MEFWGVEVKSGEPLMVEPEEETVVHLSQASLGDTKGKGSEPVYLYASIGGQKLVIGILSYEKFPQVSFDLVFEKKFQLSHSLKSGSVYFTGYKTRLQYGSDDDSIYSGSDAEEGLPINEIGKPGLPAKQAKPATIKPDESKPNPDAPKQKVKTAEPNKEDKNKNVDDDDDNNDDASSEDNEEDDSSEDQDMADASEESSDENEDHSDEEDGSDEEKPPKTAVPSKKREAEPAAKASGSDKKAKLVTPQKTDGKKPYVHVPTPYPKQAAKATANRDQAKQQKPNSSEYACKSCNRSFKSDQALQSHNKAKHASAS